MRIKAIVPLLLILSPLPCISQTFMIVAMEIRDGDELQRPFASQEGMIEGMFDLGFVSFDTGLYEPTVDWGAMDFREPLTIGRQGLAQYLLAAEVRSVTEPRNLTARESTSADKPPKTVLRIETTVRYHLFDVNTAKDLGREQIVLDNSSPDKLELTYPEFLFSVGREIAARGIDLMRRSARKR